MNQEELNSLFKYKEGNLIWKQRRANIKAGSVAGTLSKHGYIQIGVKGKKYNAHRLVYTMFNGSIPDGLHIDHINGVKNDNRIENLRLVTHQENQWNHTKAKGCRWYKKSKKWSAQIGVNGKQKHLGYFDTESEARDAYLKAKGELHAIEDR